MLVKPTSRKAIGKKIIVCKRGIWQDVVKKTNNEVFNGKMKEIWVGIKRTMNKWAGKADKEIATLRAKNDNMVNSSKGKREVLVKDYRKLGTPNANIFDLEFEKDTNMWADAIVERLKRDGSVFNELQR